MKRASSCVSPACRWKWNGAARGRPRKPCRSRLDAECVDVDAEHRVLAAASKIELGKLDPVEGLLASLDEKLLESDGSEGWNLRLNVLRGLLLLKRADRAAVMPLLRSAIETMEHDETTDNIMYVKAKQALSA